MKCESPHDCINALLNEIDKRRTVDYGDRNSVRRFNSAYNRCVRYANYLQDHYPEYLYLLTDLLNASDPHIVSHCAAMVLQLSHSTIQQKESAVTAYERLLTDNQVDPLHKLGISMSLKTWKEEIERVK